MLLMASSDLPEGCCWPWSGGCCLWLPAIYLKSVVGPEVVEVVAWPLAIYLKFFVGPEVVEVVARPLAIYLKFVVGPEVVGLVVGLLPSIKNFLLLILWSGGGCIIFFQKFVVGLGVVNVVDGLWRST